MNDFIRMSKYAGMREDLVQAGGGNSSYKLNGERMIIKASGYQLAEVGKDVGIAEVNYNKIRNFFINCENLDLLTEDDSKAILLKAYISGGKPSIETFLHSISGRYTLHTHPITVNALACRKGGEDILVKLFPDALIIKYATPGIELAKAYFEAFKKQGLQNGYFKLVFLLNHGLVVSADSAEEVINTTEGVIKTIENYLDCDYTAYHLSTKLWHYFPEKIIWKVSDSNIIDSAKKLNGFWKSVFCPDCVVFLGKKMLMLADEFSIEDIRKYEMNNFHPVVICWKKYYYILADSVKKAMEIQSILSFSAQVMKLNIGCDNNLLSDAEQNFLLGWDAEEYRKNIK